MRRALAAAACGATTAVPLEELEFQAALAQASAHGDAAFVRSVLTALFALVTILWSACFGEYWKRRQAMLGHSWGTIGDSAPPPMPNPHFRGKPGKGFYSKGLWVPLDDQKTEQILLRRQSVASVLKPETWPTDFWFDSKIRRARQVVSAALLALMTFACLVSIFLMQLFAAYMRSAEVIVGGTDLSSAIVGVAQTVPKCQATQRCANESTTGFPFVS